MLALGNSGWGPATANREMPAGMGVFSMSGLRVFIQTKPANAPAWQAMIEADDWNGGSDILIEPYKTTRKQGTTINIAMDGRASYWDEVLLYSHSRDAMNAHIRDTIYGCAMFYPLPVYFNDERLNNDRDFLEGAVGVHFFGKYRIGVFRDANHQPSLNFHGHTVTAALPSLVDNAGVCWSAKVDLINAPEVHLVLPARKELVRNAGSVELEEKCDTAIFETIASRSEHCLHFEDYEYALDLEIDLDEAAPRLSSARIEDVDEPRKHIGEHPNPVLVRCSYIDFDTANFLMMKFPPHITPLLEADVMEGYEWYDELPVYNVISVTAVDYYGQRMELLDLNSNDFIDIDAHNFVAEIKATFRSDDLPELIVSTPVFVPTSLAAHALSEPSPLVLAIDSIQRVDIGTFYRWALEVYDKSDVFPATALDAYKLVVDGPGNMFKDEVARMFENGRLSPPPGTSFTIRLRGATETEPASIEIVDDDE